MSIQNYLILAQFFVAFLISIEAGIYLIVRYRTRLALWCGLILLSLALDLACFLLQLTNPTAYLVSYLYLIQIIGYTLFCAFWLLFVFTFTQNSHWIRPRNLALIFGLPTIYILMLVVRWIQGPVAIPQGEVGSLMISPRLLGLPGSLFLSYAYGVAAFSIVVLLKFTSKSSALTRKFILPLLSGPTLLISVGVLEQAGINPFKPVSFQQLVCSLVSYLAFWIVFDLRFGSILANARETVVDQIQDGVLILDPGDRIVDLNVSAQQILGISSKNARKQTLARVWPEGAGLLTGREEPDWSVGETTILVNGLECTYDINISQFYDAYHTPIGRAIVLRNVTGRERMEKALNQRSQELQRTNAFLAALAGATVNLQKTTDPSQVLDIMGSELFALGLRCYIARLEPETNELVVRYLYTRKDVLVSVEKLLGARVIGYRLKRDRFMRLYKLLEGKGASLRDQIIQGVVSFDDHPNAQSMKQILRLIGLNPATVTIVVPLVAGDRVLGLMGVWGDDLRETDVSPLNLFASQVAWAIERAALYETEIQRSTELARTNNLVIALSKVAAQLGSTPNSEFVLDTLGIELTKVGLNCAVVSFDLAGETAFIKYLSFSPASIRAIENLTGLQVKNYAIPKRYWPGERVLKEQNPIWYPHPNEVFRRMFPAVPEAIAKQAFQFLGFGEADQLCILPLVSAERTIGAMLIWGNGLKLSDSPILSVFASQVASTLQNVYTYENEAQRAGELARSNAMIVALSNVAARLDTTSNITQVLDTLGNELKKLRINCIVGTLDADKQVMKIEYLSITPEIIQWAEKLGSFWPKEITIPRKLWPTDKAVTEKAPYWDPDPIGSTSRMFPFVPKKIFYKSFEMAGMNPEDPLCYLPMISEEDVIGILAVWGPDLRDDDIPGLSVFANQVATAMKNTHLYDQAQQEIIERTQAEAQIQEALNEKEVLLKEIHHRVKNNLQVISSLLNLQMAQTPDTNSVEGLRESQNRVRAMALIHEKLYQSNDLAQINFSTYLNSLTNSLAQTYRTRSEIVTIQVQAEKIFLDLDTAIPCGLIVNELVSNALKYAFPDRRSGRIEVSCRAHPDGNYTLLVCDDGVGLPAGFDAARCSSLGLKLVSSLVKQIDGRLMVDGANGASFEINF